MKLLSTRNPDQQAPLEEAIIQGLAPDGGLYVPQELPSISSEQLREWQELSYQDLACELAQLWYGQEIPAPTLRKMIDEAYATFQPELVELSDHIEALELFHGPTLSFKDFGARMLAQVMNHFAERKQESLTILAATSGDTGVAVASAFAGLDNIRVVILYPKGKVSPFQEGQMLSLEGNVQVFAVDGTFDDCQANVKQAFNDSDLRSAHLTSANSINIGRLIPQSWYYVYAYLQHAKKSGSMAPITFAIPSGNFGNLTACLMAKMQGVPISNIGAATNINDIIPHYLATGKFQTRPSVLTIANSMDIGNPSNWERIRYFLGENREEVQAVIWGAKKTDPEIRQTIQEAAKRYEYIVDPHGAVSIAALEDYLQDHPQDRGVAVMTGSPYKYRPLLEELTQQEFSDWPSLDASGHEPVIVDAHYETLKNLLTA